MIALASPSVAETMIGESTLGKMCRLMMRRSRVPMDCAASTNSRSLMASTSPRTMRAVFIHEVMPMTKTIRMKMPGLGSEGAAQHVAEQQDDDQQQRQQRQR